MPTSPLSLVDAGSVRPSDLVPTDFVYPDRIGEIYEVIGNTVHRWGGGLFGVRSQLPGSRARFYWPVPLARSRPARPVESQGGIAFDRSGTCRHCLVCHAPGIDTDHVRVISLP